MSKTDQYYIEKVLKGDTKSFEFLVNRYKNIVFNIVLRISKSREDAEELVQDTFLKAFKNLSTFKNKSKFSTWLYSIAYNLAISNSRKKTLNIEDINSYNNEIIDYESIYKDFEQTAQIKRRKMLKSAIEQLPETDALLITLFYFNNLTIDEIYKITGLSKSNIKVRLHRARKKMFYFLSKIQVYVVILYTFLSILN
ncbi:MAG: RNA polymerase sigma factor [Bacteroidales bacterium]|nr:RNA polymerase sigma factor [Bacteroidales bacterium]